MNYIIRNKSIITGKENLEQLYTFKNFPVFFGCVDFDSSKDLLVDMSWAICPETGIIQLDKLIPLDILYQEQHVDGTGPIWQQYYADFASYILKQEAKSFLEIGGGAGNLANLVTEHASDIKWTMVEPNPLHSGNQRIKIVPAFFDENFKYPGTVDVVVFSQVMEHAYDPNSFIKNITNFLTVGGKLIFAYPNLELWLKNKFTNALNFEHTMFLTDYFVDYLLVKYGFKINEKYFYKDHSIFYSAEKVEKGLSLPKLENKYEEYKKIFNEFIDYHKFIVNDLNQKIDKADEPTYLFGAHIFSQYLINFGLNTDIIVSVLDNSPLKQDKRLYGTNLMVESPKVLLNKGAVNVILKAGIYNEEIKKDILENINSEVIFW
jgi:SAM-dependent methyltransferase